MEFPKFERHLRGRRWRGRTHRETDCLLGVSPRMVVVAVRAIASKGPQVLGKNKPRSGNVLVRSTRFLQQKHEPGSGQRGRQCSEGAALVDAPQQWLGQWAVT